jgi:hypothetical protein
MLGHARPIDGRIDLAVHLLHGERCLNRRDTRVKLALADFGGVLTTVRRAVEFGLFPRRILALIDSSPVLGAGVVADTYALGASAIGKLVAAADEQTLSKTLRGGLKRCLRAGKPSINWQDTNARAHARTQPLSAHSPSEAAPLTAEAVAGLVRRVRFTLSGMTATLTVGALLDEHVVLDVQCLDRST